ncbi:MAG: DUF2065 family protein [Gammaproteobacteria bacterium]|jgi:uncharacterized protein YjeT (DUF2065 family)
MEYDLIAALALVLILEGLLPFLAPNLWRRMANLMAKKSDNVLRIVGFILMLLGTIILYVLHILLR